MTRKVLGCVIVFAMLAAIPTFAQTTGGIRGTVFDNDGNP